MTIPTNLPYFVLTGTGLTLIAVLYGLNRSLVDAAWPAEERARTVFAVAIILGGWLAVSVALGAAGVYHSDASDLHYSIWHRAANPDRRLPDLAIGMGEADH
jgi:hypothetical protein